MERLTAISENGKAYYPYCFREDTCDGCGSSEKCDQCELSLKVCETLAAYENTGLTPEQIRKLKERDTAKAPNKKLRHRGGFETFHCPNCDTSYQMDRRYTITDEYCPKCGKLLDSSFRSFCANCGKRLEEGR